MRQTISLLLTGMLLLAACSASGAETMETAAEYPEPRYYFEDLTAKETFTFRSAASRSLGDSSSRLSAARVNSL